MLAKTLCFLQQLFEGSWNSICINGKIFKDSLHCESFAAKLHCISFAAQHRDWCSPTENPCQLVWCQIWTRWIHQRLMFANDSVIFADNERDACDILLSIEVSAYTDGPLTLMRSTLKEFILSKLNYLNILAQLFKKRR